LLGPLEIDITPLVGSPLRPLVTSSKNPIEEIAVFISAKSPKEKNKISKIEKREEADDGFKDEADDSFSSLQTFLLGSCKY